MADSFVTLTENPEKIIQTHPKAFSISHEGDTASHKDSTFSQPIFQKNRQSTVGTTGFRLEKVSSNHEGFITYQPPIRNKRRIELLSGRGDSIGIYNGTNNGQKT